MANSFTTFLLCLWFAGSVAGQDFSCNTTNSLRLNPASYFTSDRSGRVEICSCDSQNLACEWATITIPSTFNSWGWKNAMVACRELYPEDYGVMSPILQDTLPIAAQAPSSQLVHSSWVSCDGTEARVSECSQFQTSVTSHSRDAHIQCRSSEPAVGSVRLTGNPVADSQGIVEYYQGVSAGWVTLCTESWDPADAIVACVQLGYESGTVENLQTSFYGTNYGPVGLYNVGCGGSELLLSSCPSFSSGSCADVNQRAGVLCTSSALAEGSIRLTTGSESGNSQRVEVLYDGRWGTVCGQGWDINDGSVICRALGLGVAFIENAPTFTSMSDSRPVWLTELTCSGSESSLAQCTKMLPVGYAPSCDHDQDAALTCIPEDRYCQVANTLRLNQAGYFSDSRAGRVEICNCDLASLGCEWATIAVPADSTSWGWKNALVACRELLFPLDYGVRNPILQDTLPGGIQASSLQLAQPLYFLCDGTESSLDQCFTTPSSDTSHLRDAYIQCRLNETMAGDIRLISSTANNAYGIIEFYHSDTRTWVTACSDFWDDEDANVACVQLGYESGTASIYDTENFAGSNYGNMGLFEVSCTGTEAFLNLCSYSTIGSCSNPAQRGGVVCISSDFAGGSTRLVPGTDSNSGIQRVEILYDGRWGTICGTSWDVEDASVICSAYGGGVAEVPDSNVQGLSSPIWLTEVACGGAESIITECTTTLPVGYVPSCTHTQDAAVNCRDEGGLSGGEIAGIVIGSLVGVVALILIIIYSDPKKRKEAAEAWARTKQRVQNAPHAAASRASAWKTSFRKACTRRAAAREAAAREKAAKRAAAREAAAREATEREAAAREAATREAAAREEAAMAEARRREQASVEIHAVIESGFNQPQTGAYPAPTDDVKQGLPPLAHPEPESKLREGAPPSYNEAVLWNPTEKTEGAVPMLPYPASNPPQDLHVPYPVSSDLQGYPPASNPGYPPAMHPAFPPPVVYPLQPSGTPIDHPPYPVEGAIDSPLPPLLEQDGQDM